MGPALIGVTTSEFRQVGEHHETPEGEPPRREMALGTRYAEAVAAAGGIPVILAPCADADAVLDRLDGLCLSGGPDVHPSAYGAEPHERLGPTERDADDFELRLTRRALARDLPVLGICRGAQVLNVAGGGTLEQHVDGHRQTAPGSESTHAVRVARRSLLASVLGTARLDVNSFHHQTVGRLGRGLRIAARSDDGVIEGVEDRAKRFVLGVQWHAECLVDRAEHLRLFEALVRAASARPGVAAA